MSFGVMGATEFGLLLVDRDPAVRRQVREVMDWRNWEQLFGHVQVASRVLGEEEYAYAWPDATAALQTLRYPWTAFETLWDQFARAGDDGFRDRLGVILGLPAGTELPEFPAAIEHEPGIQHWGWEPEGADARRCCHVAALVALLGSSTEWVRREAYFKLARGGPGILGVLREVRKRPSRVRGVALALLAEFGWQQLDPADLALVYRLLRMKQATEVPEPVLLSKGWYALPTTDQAAVLDAFGLCDPIPATLRMGFGAWLDQERDPKQGRRPANLYTDLNVYHDGWGNPYSYCEVFVTPALDGWTLVLADWQPSDEPDKRCAELSKRFGAAHFYEQICEQDFWSHWCVAEDGAVRIHCAVGGAMPEGDDDWYMAVDGEVMFYQADALGSAPTREALRAWLEANDHGRGHRTPPPRTVGEHDVNALRRRFGREALPAAKLNVTPQEPPAEWDVGVEGAAPRLSVSPETLGPQTSVVGTGVLAVPIPARNRVRMGALLI
ncbi:hypothetical protein [Nocardia sp. NPDC051832]|uniref:hypothetical protein n=1 Tax=Nocardia sp. NPDC051832 TaxID=3155673 RepID=UPI003430BF77